MFSGRWVARYLRLAREVSTWSKDPSTRVGCVIIDPRRRVVATGYNGFPEAIEDRPEWLEDREMKYQLVVHAEVNAIINARTDVRGCYAFLTHPPCAECTKVLVAAGIAEIHYINPTADLMSRWAGSLKAGSEMAARANVVHEGWELEGDSAF